LALSAAMPNISGDDEPLVLGIAALSANLQTD
jgi:hypothetical protein